VVGVKIDERSSPCWFWVLWKLSFSNDKSFVMELLWRDRQSSSFSETCWEIII